jgi:hypothetical protein
LVLEFLTKDKSLDEEVDLFPIASGVSHILRTEYTVSVQPLDVQSKCRQIISWKWNLAFLTFFLAVVRSCREVRRFLA